MGEKALGKKYYGENFACADCLLSVFVFESDERDRDEKGKQSVRRLKVCASPSLSQ